jgi:Spy/CpxP family protein refolding chaperone
MKSRRKFTAFLVLIGVCLFSSFSLAQPRDRPVPPPRRPMPPEELLKDMRKELNLTSEQETKIRKIMEAQREETKKIFESDRKAREERMEQMEKEREAMRVKMEKQWKETDVKISEVLTDEQKKKFEEFQKKRSEMPSRGEWRHMERDEPMPDECPDHCE